MEPQVKSLILRFRDLATAPGGTIAQHRDLIGKERHVWWAWWKKPPETIPDSVFRQLKLRAMAEGLELFLVDSGQGLLYKATCTDIDYDPTHEPKNAPGVSPDYYSKEKYSAWFKFEDISKDPIEECDLSSTDPIDHSLLRSFSYVRVDDFFSSKTSRYAPFYGKVIHSIRELVQQNRTIWFFRDARSTDKSHEISLTDSHKIEPHDFPRSFRQAEPRNLNLLWLSDLHFSIKGHHAFQDSPSTVGDSLSRSLEKALTDHEVNELAGVLISGDLTWEAHPKEYRQAEELIHKAQSWARLVPYDFLVCPGNHDLKFTKDPSLKNAPVPARVTRSRPRRAFVDFYQRLFYKQPNEYLSSGRRFILGGAVPVEIVSLNSSLLEQRKGVFQGHGYVGDEQLRNAAQEMGWDGDLDRPRCFRIVMVHHHLVPVTFREQPVEGWVYSVVLDAEALSRWIVHHRVNLVLHGHMHHPFYVRLSRPVDPNKPGDDVHTFDVVGMGSTGVKEDHLGEVKKNVFGVLRFDRGHVALTVYSVDPKHPSQELWTVTVPYQRSVEE